MANASRADPVVDDLMQLQRKFAEGVRDGEALLPDYASVEPGALLHKIYEVWKRQPGGRERAHSFANLNTWTPGTIASLQHKLKGRLPIEREDDAQHLLTAMLTHWSDQGPHPALHSNVSQFAHDLTGVLFGPIYGIKRKNIRIVESPGINTATFMEKRKADASTVVFPVLDRAMFGADPVSTLAGTRLSLARYLARSDSESPSDGGRVIYALRSELPDAGLNYVRYLHERSFLATEFRLLQITADAQWPLEHVNKKFPCWSNLQRQLWVYIVPSDERTDIVPDRVPAEWKDEVVGGFDKFGFVVVEKKEDNKDAPLEYWKYLKENGAFSQIKRQQHKMVTAHRGLIETVTRLAGERNVKEGPKVWSAQDVLNGEDLQEGSSGSR